jgi:hypothetical protein
MAKLRIFAIMATAFVLVTGVASSASAMEVGSGQHQQVSASHLGDCVYKVVWKTAGMWEKPTRSSPFLGYKHRGQHVWGFSRLTYYNSGERILYRAVDSSRARDGIAWMNARALRRVHC